MPRKPTLGKRGKGLVLAAATAWLVGLTRKERGSQTMRKTLLSLALAALAAFTLLVPAAGQAQTIPPLGDNKIGVYTESDFTGGTTFAHLEGVSPGVIQTVYILLTGASVGVFGWEADFDFQGSSAITGVRFPVNGIDVAPLPDIVIVGFSTGVFPDAQGVAILGEMDFLLIGTEDRLFVGPTDPSSIPNAMSYLAQDENNDLYLVEMFPVSGDFETPIFGVNVTVDVATESSSWTDVKRLYR